MEGNFKTELSRSAQWFLSFSRMFTWLEKCVTLAQQRPHVPSIQVTVMTSRARVAVVCVICVLFLAGTPWLRALIYDHHWPLTSTWNSTIAHTHTHPGKTLCIISRLCGKRKKLEEKNPLHCSWLANRKVAYHTGNLVNKMLPLNVYFYLRCSRIQSHRSFLNEDDGRCRIFLHCTIMDDSFLLIKKKKVLLLLNFGDVTCRTFMVAFWKFSFRFLTGSLEN